MITITISDTIASFIALFPPTLGVAAIIVGRPYIRSKTQNKLPLYICNIIFIIGIIIYISFLACMLRGKHINSNIAYTEYPIQKLTLNNVYFDDKKCSFDESSYMILEEPDEDFANVVIKEKEEYEIQWFFKVKTSDSKYHVYLSKELYDRLQDGNVIYERNN